MDHYTYIIVGGGLAGGRACQGIRKIDEQGRIALVAGEDHLPYERPPLSKGYLAGREQLDHVYWKTGDFYAQNDVTLIQGVRAAGIDPAAHQVRLEDGRVLEYDKLLLATGARARRLPLPGSDLPGVYTLRTIEDSDAIRRAAQAAAQKGGRALVLGGSFIGSEVAASLSQLGLAATVVFPESRLLEAVAPEELSAHLALLYEQHGVDIWPGVRPLRLEGAERVERAHLTDGRALDVDMVVMGVGVELNTELARDVGLDMWPGGGVVVDEFLRTSIPDIYAAGDIAAWPDPTFGRRLRVEHWDVAYRQGMHAGRSMAGEDKPYATLPYFFSDLFDFSFEVWGIASGWDQVVRRGTIGSGRFAFYFFAAGRLNGVLAVNRPEEERKPMQALVKARAAYDDIASALCNENSDLGAL
jgi:3-phenylpropionate/trans-cinnamate dioxygenase ferredoxin reductase subunit